MDLCLRWDNTKKCQTCGPRIKACSVVANPSHFHPHSLTQFIFLFVSNWLWLIIHHTEAKVLVATGVSLGTWHPLLTHAFPFTTDGTNRSLPSGCWLGFFNSGIPRKKVLYDLYFNMSSVMAGMRPLPGNVFPGLLTLDLILLQEAS